MSLMKFIWGEDDEFGGHGWIAKDYPHFNAIEPDRIAHDVLDHLPGGLKHGAVVDELLALGARWHNLVDSGWWGSQGYYPSPENTFAHELTKLLRDMENNDRLYVGKPAASFDADVMPYCDILAETAHVAKDEKRWNELEKTYGENNWLLKRMVRWMTIGYQAAEKRFAGHHAWEVSRLFDRLNKECGRYKHCDLGDVLTIRVDERALDFKLKITSPQWW